MVEPIPAPSAILKADTATLTFRAEKDGSLRVLYGNWEDAKVFRPGESIELVARNGQVQAYRDWDMETLLAAEGDKPQESMRRVRNELRNELNMASRKRKS
jgi:hypothetical protein